MIPTPELKRLAEEATDGPWKACGTIYEHMNCEVRSGAKGEGQPIAQVWDGPNAFPDARYIALANPATIKALIADYERMRGALELAANRLDRLSLEMPDPSSIRLDALAWTDEARQALEGQSRECPECEGSGKVVEAARTTGVNQHSACQRDCDECDGSGRIPAASEGSVGTQADRPKSQNPQPNSRRQADD